MRRTIAIIVLASLAGGAAGSAAGEPITKTDLKPFSVTVRVFDPVKGAGSGQDYVLPVDSPDAEHAVASTMANAVSFTKTMEAGKPLSVAFTCVKVEPR